MDNIWYIIGQVFGGIALLFGFLSYQMKSQKLLLLMQLGTSICLGLNYLCVGAISGAYLSIIIVARNVAYNIRNRKGSTDKIVPIIFAVALSIMGIITWEAWYSIFVFVGLFVNTIGLSFQDPQNVRKSILISSPLVLIYDLISMAYGGALYESVAVISAIIGIIRTNRALKKQQ